MMCPVCGKFEFTELQETDLLFRDEMQCSICGWKYDQRQHEDHDLKNGLNELSLNEYQAWYKQKIKENPDFNFRMRITRLPLICARSAIIINSKMKTALTSVRFVVGVMTP